MIEGITTSDNKPLDLDDLIPMIGYQIEHKVTGRILPTCTHFQIYMRSAAVYKLLEVHEIMGIDVLDYKLVPIYEHDVCESGWVFIENKIDTEKGK
jgi:hypothetical protein